MRMDEVQRISALLQPTYPPVAEIAQKIHEQLFGEAPTVTCITEEKPHMEIPYELQVDHIIFSPPATTVLWKDGTKTTVKCYQDEFCEDIGFAMACVRKLYGTRGRFMAQLKNAYRQPKKEKKTKKEAVQETPKAAQTLEFTLMPVVKPNPSQGVCCLDELMKQVAGDDSIGVVTGVKYRDAE